MLRPASGQPPFYTPRSALLAWFALSRLKPWITFANHKGDPFSSHYFTVFMARFGGFQRIDNLHDFQPFSSKRIPATLPLSVLITALREGAEALIPRRGSILMQVNCIINTLRNNHTLMQLTA